MEPYRGLSNAATAEDFRDLARTIEELRTSRQFLSEPQRHSQPAPGIDRRASFRAEAPAPAGPLGARATERPPAGRPAPFVRETSSRQPASLYESAPRQDGLGTIAREIASAADKTDVRRLERLLNEVLERLDALGHASEPARPEPRRRSSFRSAERHPFERERTEGAPASRTGEARATRQRAADTRRPSAYADVDPPGSRTATGRASTPRRLFT